MSTWQQITDALAHEFADFGAADTIARTAFRLILACLLGAALGYERESKGKAAGVRTHMLVALGAALFILVPLGRGVEDPGLTRVIQGIVAGIGFLGAGAILKGRPGEEIEGLTTAASVWTTAALGVAAGLGRASTAILGAILALIILQVLPAPPPRPGNRPNPNPNSPSDLNADS